MFANLGTQIKLILRRDRIKLPIWIFAIAMSLLLMVPLLKEVYADPSSLLSIYQTFSANPAGLFLTGPMDAPVFGAFMTIETLLWWGMAIAFMNTLLVVRHTRQNEEMGAQELILSGQTHRATSLVAVLIVALFANLILAFLVSAGLLLANDSFKGADLWLYGVAFGVFGLVWAALTSVVVQLAENTRLANGIMAGLIGTTFLLRGVGDFMGHIDQRGVIEAAWPSMLSPFGWLQMTRSLTFPEWSPLMISSAVIILVIPLAFWLLSLRDIGAGILPSRRGRARATKSLRSGLGLTLKLQKNIFIGWVAGILVIAVTIGSLVPTMGSVYEGSEEMQRLIAEIGGAGEVVPSFLAAMLSIMVLMALAYVLQALGRMSGEEANRHTEQLLATRFSRLGWLGKHVGVVTVGGVLLPVISGFVMAVSVNVASDAQVDVGEYVLAGLSYAPVVVAFIGLYCVLFGIIPQIAGLVSWIYFGFVTFALWIAPMLQLEDWFMNLSILSHVAAVPVEAIKWQPLIWIGVSAGALILIGFLGLRRRDMQ